MKQKETNYLEFYRNLPPKICVDCGHVIIEQHESYLTKCEHCLSKEHE
ncbi:MAG TPA: protein YhfH [Bacillus sp. (in: firmicutes)]|nr:protein YhfH [Bacillus sp. (in: firmicutes)]